MTIEAQAATGRASSQPCHPEEWVGLGFVATIENAPAEVLRNIDGIESVAAQIIWGTTEQKPARMQSYLDDCRIWSLVPVGWGWCNATDPAGAQVEGRAHAECALDLGLDHYIANMEEPYDAHGDSNSPKFLLPDYYLDTFREIAPDIEFAVTTTPRWASSQDGLRRAGAVIMPQAFPLAAEGGHGVAECVKFCISWGWTQDRIRPLCQVYETNGQVPPAEPFLDESEDYGVGLVPYILEQALGGQGRALLDALYPAIIRAPQSGFTPPEDLMEKIGKQHGITGFADWLRAQSDAPPRGPKYDPNNVDTWPWPDKIERTLNILAADHDTQAGG